MAHYTYVMVTGSYGEEALSIRAIDGSAPGNVWPRLAAALRELITQDTINILARHGIEVRFMGEPALPDSATVEQAQKAKP